MGRVFSRLGARYTGVCRAAVNGFHLSYEFRETTPRHAPCLGGVPRHLSTVANDRLSRVLADRLPSRREEPAPTSPRLAGCRRRVLSPQPLHEGDRGLTGEPGEHLCRRDDL